MPDQLRLNIARLQHTKPFMPPFAGTARELEAIVQLIQWEAAHRPAAWPVSQDAGTLSLIDTWLAEAGTDPGGATAHRAGER